MPVVQFAMAVSACHLVLALSAAAALLSPSSAKTYTNCELAKELRGSYGFPASQIPTWVCIAKHESSFNTRAINKKNKNGSWDYGLFQINNKYWCDRGAGKGCGVPCQTLLDDMDAVAKCVRTVYNETKRLKGNGYLAWSTYGKCKANPGKEVAGCKY